MGKRKISGDVCINPRLSETGESHHQNANSIQSQTRNSVTALLTKALGELPEYDSSSESIEAALFSLHKNDDKVRHVDNVFLCLCRMGSE